MVNIHGLWGSGKSTIIRGLREELHKERWIVVNFNAWQHQRLGSPWWWLSNAVAQQGIGQLPQTQRARVLLLKARQRLWYLQFVRARWLPFLFMSLVLLLFALVMIIVFGFLLPRSGAAKNELDFLSQGAQSLAAIVAGGSAVITLVIGFVRPLTQGPAGALTDATRDPMRSISSHFDHLIRNIGGKAEPRVAVFIEDLDRCQGSYVVELLEGIQTLFKDTPVCYVVAADQRWLCTSFATVYGTFATALEDAGRPAGYMFLEKAFQLTTSVPPLPLAQYLRSVLQR
jgi:hypothetical protein